MMYGNGILNKNICGIVVAILTVIGNASAANVVARPTTSTNRVSATRPTQAAARRMPTMTTSVSKTPTTTTSSSTSTPSADATTVVDTQTETTQPTTTTATTTTTTNPEPKVETSKVENKSAQFGSGLSSKSSSERDAAAATLAELVRAQRAALDAAGAVADVHASAHSVTGTGENACDTSLRECMIQKCGSNFSKCIADTDTTFFDKMDTCRRNTNCTGHEYQLFSVEIKADRDLNAKLATYNATIDCGNNYDACIVAQCGATYSKCIGKSAGDTAIAKCENIAKSCIEYDSGLAMRTMGVFGELRQGAERQIAVDEQRLYALREEMRSVCSRLGAMFDERSLDCVYTVNFRAGNDSTLFASKKLYAGSTFDCSPNWFGIDITTFRENAFRETRVQTAASSAMLGSGVGQAVGALTSGAISRAIDRYTADRAVDKALKECMQYYTESECRAQVGGATPTSTGTTKKDTTGKGLSGSAKGIEDALKDASEQLGNGNKNTPAANENAKRKLSDLSPEEKQRNELIDEHEPNVNQLTRNGEAAAETPKPENEGEQVEKILNDVKADAAHKQVNLTKDQEDTILAFIKTSLDDRHDVKFYKTEVLDEKSDKRINRLLVWLRYLDWEHESSEERYKEYSDQCASIGSRLCPEGTEKCPIFDKGAIDGQYMDEYFPGCQIQIPL